MTTPATTGPELDDAAVFCDRACAACADLVEPLVREVDAAAMEFFEVVVEGAAPLEPFAGEPPEGLVPVPVAVAIGGRIASVDSA